jgi:hypothetical protein
MSHGALNSWSYDALVEALGQPEDEAYQRDLAAPSTSVPVLRWACSDAGFLVADGDHDGVFRLRASCGHRHDELLRIVDVLVTNVCMSNSAGSELRELPGDLAGVVLHCSVLTPVDAYLRIDAYLDANKRLSVVREIPVGTLRGGSQKIRLRLDNALVGGPKEPPARSNVELRIEALTVETALRDRGAEGVLLWKDAFPVESTLATSSCQVLAKVSS